MKQLIVLGGDIAETNLHVGLLAEGLDCNVQHIGNAQIRIEYQDHLHERVVALIPRIFSKIEGRNIL